MINFKLSNGKGAFTQWDTGQYLIPINPPSSAEYFLAWYGSDTGSANQLVVDEDGYVLIPDKVFQESGTIKVYCRNTTTGEFTAHSPIINIKSADKPDGYIADDTDFAEYIAKVKDYIDDGLSGKVGHAEYTDDVLYLYDSEDKENLIASIKIQGGSGGISESKCKEIIEAYGYATTDSLSVYAKSADLAKVAKSGSYEDLSDKPDIPDAYDDTALRALINLHSTELETQAGDIDKLETGKQDKGDYALNSDIPTKTSQLTNDSGYITSSYHDSTKQDTLTDSDKQAIADLHTDAFTADYQAKVDTMYFDWTATDSALTALEGVI